MNVLFLLYFIFIFIFFYSSIKGFGLLSPVSLVMATTLPYSAAPIIDIVFFNNSNNYNVENINSLIIYCITFYIPFTFFSWLSVSQQKITHMTWKCYWNFNPTVFLMGFIALFSIYVRMSLDISIVAEEDGRAAIYKNKPLLFDLIKLLISAYIICFSLVYLHSQKTISKVYIFLLLTMFLLAETLVLGDRRVWLVTFLATSSVIFSDVKKVPVKVMPVIILGLISFLAIGVIRGGGGEDIADFIRVMNISNMEFGTFSKIYDYCSSSGCEYNYYSYMNIPSQLVPSLLLNDRPLPPSALYALDYDFNYYSSGGTYAYNFILESIQNFNAIGPFLMGIIVSTIFYAQSRMRSDFRYAIGAILVFSFSFFFRMELLSIVKIAFIWATLLLVLLIISGKFIKTQRH